MPTLADKLKRLGLKSAAHLPPVPTKPPQTEAAIENFLPGHFQPTPHGPLFVVKKQYPLSYRPGESSLGQMPSLQLVAEWAGDNRITSHNLESFVFLDTETTGLAGGTGTYAFLIGVGRYQNGHFHLAQFFMRNPLDEPAQLAALTDFLNPCTVLVTFNGKSFDVPLLNTRYISQGQPSPLAAPAQFDLLHLARRLWRDRLARCSLGHLEQHILQASRSQEDIPGWLIPDVYFTYLRSGDARPLKSIFYHNALDILAMAALLNHIAHLLADPLHSQVEHALDLAAIGRLYETSGQTEQAITLYQQSLNRGLPPENYKATLHRLSFIHKRRGEMPIALKLWQEAAAKRHIYAHVELAKFYEHHTHNYHQAAHWTQTALALVNLPQSPRVERHRYRPELEYRLARLQRKIKK